ncbi:hypothetical protein Jab_1c18870 [Janthinobacterium sp. HH01]|uniref:hypothetical protein n=1 Tax=Janthinobacterium sp. HH01 TaxID=1198452 RepID=UPI0002AEA05D|nr:hypothetical protein [Janthinobacterium sp. HH01]ELX13265.1 hypothetical protein Jab_1c18870 [Janthinobacterium sp. HH01]
MNMLKPARTLAFLLGALASPDAGAQGRGHGGIIVGAPLYLQPAVAPSLPRRLDYCGNLRGYFLNLGACLVPWRMLTATVVPSP